MLSPTLTLPPVCISPASLHLFVPPVLLQALRTYPRAHGFMREADSMNTYKRVAPLKLGTIAHLLASKVASTVQVLFPTDITTALHNSVMCLFWPVFILQTAYNPILA